MGNSASCQKKQKTKKKKNTTAVMTHYKRNVSSCDTKIAQEPMSDGRAGRKKGGLGGWGSGQTVAGKHVWPGATGLWSSSTLVCGEASPLTEEPVPLKWLIRGGVERRKKKSRM